MHREWLEVTYILLEVINITIELAQPSLCVKQMMWHFSSDQIYVQVVLILIFRPNDQVLMKINLLITLNF